MSLGSAFNLSFQGEAWWGGKGGPFYVRISFSSPPRVRPGETFLLRKITSISLLISPRRRSDRRIKGPLVRKTCLREPLPIRSEGSSLKELAKDRPIEGVTEQRERARKKVIYLLSFPVLLSSVSERSEQVNKARGRKGKDLKEGRQTEGTGQRERRGFQYFFGG